MEKIPFDADNVFRIPDLHDEACIVVDRWGIPHIQASSLSDLWFVQGFNSARDRLWQIDLWRKRGLGLLAADFGPGFLEQDRASRHFLFRGDMTAEWASYAPDTSEICTRFVGGINAFIALCDRCPDLLPPEFGIMGTQPLPWQAEDVLRIRSHGLTRNAISEVQRLNMLDRADAAADLLRKFIQPATDVMLAEGVCAASVPMEALTIFKLAQANVTFTPERLAATLDQAHLWRRVNEMNEVLFDPDFSGSNNWVVHGSRTTTGSPILASDPHRAHSLPSLRYIVHLTAPGFDAVGAGEPAVPGISIGHNGEAAFGLTIFGADQEDVYLEETDPAAPDRYRHQGAWRNMRPIIEPIEVKGCAVQQVSFHLTCHGPVIWRNESKTRAVSIRSVWFEPGAAPYMASLSLLRARSPTTFRAAAEAWGTPSVNLVYADRGGDIAWSPGGFIPLRTNWRGLVPVPGDGSHEWQGMVPASSLPFTLNPEKGFFATANELNLPPDWPHERWPVGFEWTDASRATRIHEVLAGSRSHDVAASRALQTDVLSVPARRCLALLADIAEPVLDAAAALSLLKDWNCRLEATSAAAALFEVWWLKHLKPALIERLVVDTFASALVLPGDTEGILQSIEHPDARFGENPAQARDLLLQNSLAAAYRDLTARLGPDASAWTWGRLHHGYFEHMLTPLLERASSRSLDVGPFPKGGSAVTPMHTGYRASDFRIVAGASFRMVVDLADPDRSVVINAPGQSGDPRSVHYADLAPLWANGDYVNMLYSKAAITRNTHFTWRLLPC